jgi:probable phosphoglycerate mutase
MSRTILVLAFASALAAGQAADAATFLFIRHAESTTNSGTAATPEEIVNPPLTDKGKQQALDLVNVLKDQPITTIFVSSYQRTALTIQPTADLLGLTPIVDADIREWSFGDGTVPLDLTKIGALFGEWAKGNTAAKLPGVPDSESLDELVARVVPAYKAIFDAYKGKDGVVAIVGHGGSIGWTMPYFASNVPLGFGFSNGLRNTGIVTVKEARDGTPYVSDWQGIAFEEPAPVPLPATGLLLAGVLAGLSTLRRRRAA